MAHNNGRIYIDPNTTGVEIADLQQVLGRGTGDLGLLCSDQEWYDNGGTPTLRPLNPPRINKWAKFKPFRNSAIGFSLDKTQASPELRSPDRLAQALLANYGLTIPRFGASDFKTHYSDPWVYNHPRGYNGGGNDVHEWYRILDFDGYQHELWQVGPVGTRGIYTIFDGYLGVPNSVVFAGDYIQMSIQCAYDGDTGIEGLLYPYDFLRDNHPADDLSQYYMGIALLDSQSRLWVITGERMDTHHSLYDVNASLVATIPNNVADGALIALPILASSQYATWDSAPGMGYFVSLDGQYLSLTKSSSTRKLVINVEVIYNNPGVTLNFSFRNQSSTAVQVSNLYGFLMSQAAENNEADDGYPAPSYQGMGVYGFIDTNWPSVSLNTPTVFPVSNSPDIYLTDWAPNYRPVPSIPAYLAARGYANAYADFKTANNNSSTIASGATVTWTKTFNNISEDDFGSYAEYMRFALCVRVSPDSPYVETFIADE